MNDIFKRHGSFSISIKPYILEDVDELLAIMSEVIIVRAEHMFHNDTIEYYGYSKLFDIVELGMKEPEYEFIINRDWDMDEEMGEEIETIEVTVEKVK